MFPFRLFKLRSVHALANANKALELDSSNLNAHRCKALAFLELNYAYDAVAELAICVAADANNVEFKHLMRTATEVSIFNIVFSS